MHPQRFIDRAIKWYDEVNHEWVNDDIRTKVSWVIEAIRYKQGNIKWSRVPNHILDGFEIPKDMPKLHPYHDHSLCSLAKERDKCNQEDNKLRKRALKGAKPIKDITKIDNNIRYNLLTQNGQLHALPRNWDQKPKLINVSSKLQLKRTQLEERAENYKRLARDHFQVPRIYPNVTIIGNRSTTPTFTRLKDATNPMLLVHPGWDKLQQKSTNDYLIAAKLNYFEPPEELDEVQVMPILAWPKKEIRKRFKTYSAKENEEIELSLLWLAWTATNASICRKRSTAIQSVRTKVRNNVMKSFGSI